jgi:phytoene dehydrogenase-like protein
MNPSIAIVGAGLAGLTCAKVLRDRGIDDFIVLESSDGPGGRVRTDRVGDFYLDRGFQVLFAAYPSVKKHLNLAALELCEYSPGAVLVQGDRHYPIGDPLRLPSSLLPSLRNPLISLGDKAAVLLLRAKLWITPIETLWQQPDLPTIDFLKKWGFSDRIVERFFKPFYGGIFLDSELKTSARLFQFYFKLLSEGAIATPKLGMGAIADQLASHLQPEQLRYNVPVEQLLREGDRITGVQLQTGEMLSCRQVVCATDAPTTRRLLNDLPLDPPIPATARAVSCLYFSSPVSLHSGKTIHLNSAITTQTLINNCIQLSNVSPALSPAGRHLLSVSVLGIPALQQEELVSRCKSELSSWFPHVPVDRLEFLKVYRIPFAQFDQPPGLHDSLPQPQTGLQGLVLAGEYTRQSSIEGAMSSGERAALWAIAEL